MSVAEFDRLFPSDEACQRYLLARRWPKGVVKCPRCGNEKVYALKTRPFHWVCNNHKTVYRFSLTVGTIFQNSNIRLLRWFKVLYLMLTSKKGSSALQLHRTLGSESAGKGSYKTAWYMCHRLRAGLADPEFVQLMGIVEVDETYIGGKDKNRHRSQRIGIPGGGGMKATVVGAIARKGNVVCQMIEVADTKTLDKFIRMAIDKKVTLIATDDAGGYRKLMDAGLPHGTVAHMRGEYVRGAIHTNSIESFWSLLKRGVVGTYHSVSRKYLPLYLNEFVFRFNNRKTEDIFGVAVASY